MKQRTSSYCTSRHAWATVLPFFTGKGVIVYLLLGLACCVVEGARGGGNQARLHLAKRGDGYSTTTVTESHLLKDDDGPVGVNTASLKVVPKLTKLFPNDSEAPDEEAEDGEEEAQNENDLTYSFHRGYSLITQGTFQPQGTLLVYGMC